LLALTNDKSTFAASDINETKAKQQNNVIKNNQYKQQQQEETMRERVRDI
jgi:hypothetical protein